MPETSYKLLDWESNLSQFLSYNAYHNKEAGWLTSLRLNKPALDDELEFVRQFWGVSSLPNKFVDLFKLTNGFDVHFSNGNVAHLVYSVERLPILMQRCFETMAAHPMVVGRFLPFLDYFDHPMGYLRNYDNSIDDVLWTLDVDTIGYALANPELPISDCFRPCSRDLWSFFACQKS